MMEESREMELLRKYLQNKTAEEERFLLEKMLRNDHRIHSLLENELKNAAPEMDDETSERLYEHIHAGISAMKKPFFERREWRGALRWAVLFILPVVTALSTYFLTIDRIERNAASVTVSAGKGEKAEIVLADGSRVWLNSGSSLSCRERFSRKERNVHLAGEAYFEVAKEKKRPFIVKTKEMDIEALGTAFNVSAYDDERFVSSVLVEGKVKVTANGQARILTANDRAIYDKTNHTLSTDSVYASDFTEWKNGNLYFRNRSFEEIANTLTRVFDVEIRFESEELRSMRFSGTLGSSSIRNALDILSLTSQMRYRMNGTTIELFHKD